MLSALAYVSALPLQAGEIAGLPANTPPALDSPVAFGFYNDFLGRGGRSDDYRTQQLILTGRFAERWYATLDHSILMFQEPSDPGRVDQLSATLGYALIDSRDDDSWQRVLLGTGVRTHGDLAGERMQNGFHQLFDIDLEFLPYREGEDDSAVAWVDGQHQWVQASDARFRPGYWLRGSALVTSDGQLDAAIGAYATLSHRSIELWAGLRQDWREGYDSAVMRAAASVESDTAAVLGLAWGPLVIETVQQFNGEGSYGSLRFVSVPQSRDAIDARRARYAVSLAFLLPDIRVGAEGRSAPRWLNRDDAIWTTSLAARIDTGQA